LTASALRYRAAATLGAATAGLARFTGLGAGTATGGRVTLAVEPRALRRATSGRQLALVSGTNGKSTTRTMLTAALGSVGPVVSNRGGANVPAGLTAALLGDRAAGIGVLEVDEPFLPAVMDATRPEVVVLLNLSRDQLDRSAEVQQLAARWRAAFAARPVSRVFANADDPLVAWAAVPADRIEWVAAGLGWRADATLCPACGAPLRFTGDGWFSGCGFQRPEPDWRLTDSGLIEGSGQRYPVALRLPGEANKGNAAMAAAAAGAFGVPTAAALTAIADIDQVEGRHAERLYAGRLVRLLLAKNPAGWQAALSMIRPDPAPVVIAVNAGAADGRDPAWLWDVPFEQLRGRLVVAAGERLGRGRAAAVRGRRAHDRARSTGRAASARLDRRRGARQLHRVPRATEGARRCLSHRSPSHSSIRRCSGPTATAETPRCWLSGCVGGATVYACSPSASVKPCRRRRTSTSSAAVVGGRPCQWR